MAMEINSKKLHMHATPVVVLLLGLLIVTGLAWHTTTGVPNAQLVARSMVTRVVSVHSSTHGVARITLQDDRKSKPANLKSVGQTASQSLATN